MTATPCPNARNHTPSPSGYCEKNQWAQQKARRHWVTQCPVCGLWAIWRRRAAEESDWGGHPEDYEPGAVETITEAKQNQ